MVGVQLMFYDYGFNLSIFLFEALFNVLSDIDKYTFTFVLFDKIISLWFFYITTYIKTNIFLYNFI